ncbi:MAG: TraR/DksA C4-type zinc finger protein [Rhodobacter sp.]|nr:TraR/DksA C4-type zinc finger protein [Rhodobacter sp.]
METEQLEILRTRIQEQLAELELDDALGLDAQKTVSLDQQSVGRLSRMDAMQQQAMAKATQARRGQMRQRLVAALARMDDDEFGYCSECGEDIPLKRLELDPTVLICVSCATG